MKLQFSRRPRFRLIAGLVDKLPGLSIKHKAESLKFSTPLTLAPSFILEKLRKSAVNRVHNELTNERQELPSFGEPPLVMCKLENRGCGQMKDSPLAVCFNQQIRVL